MSGILLVIFKPFRIHDKITLKNGSVTGIVEDINYSKFCSGRRNYREFQYA